jgi:hypothetical protein
MRLELWGGSNMNILHLPLEFNRFFSAKKLAYPVGIGMVDGLEANNVTHLTVPLMYHDQLWLRHLKELVGDRKFDQVWLEVVHSVVPEDILEWVASLAPVRVGFIIESLTMAPEEFTANPVGTQRRVDNLKQKLPYLTHAVVCDMRDLDVFDIPTMFGTATIPEGVIRTPSSTSGKAIFCGTAYGDRGEWLERLEDKLIVNPPSPEDSSNLPRIFDQLFAINHSPQEYGYFYSNWQSVRQSLYSIWINHLHSLRGCAMINLPHRTQVLSGRIFENMAAGKPIISPLMHNSIDDLFEDGVEILYYDDIDGLLSCIDKLQNNLDLGFHLAEAARVKILENHTTEKRVEEVLKFVRG